jgi:hypothetical protein
LALLGSNLAAAVGSNRGMNSIASGTNKLAVRGASIGQGRVIPSLGILASTRQRAVRTREGRGKSLGKSTLELHIVIDSLSSDTTSIHRRLLGLEVGGETKSLSQVLLVDSLLVFANGLSAPDGDVFVVTTATALGLVLILSLG